MIKKGGGLKSSKRGCIIHFLLGSFFHVSISINLHHLNPRARDFDLVVVCGTTRRPLYLLRGTGMTGAWNDLEFALGLLLCPVRDGIGVHLVSVTGRSQLRLNAPELLVLVGYCTEGLIKGLHDVFAWDVVRDDINATASARVSHLEHLRHRLDVWISRLLVSGHFRSCLAVKPERLQPSGPEFHAYSIGSANEDVNVSSIVARYPRPNGEDYCRTADECVRGGEECIHHPH